ncbi:hypothetical protein [Streptomyces lydicus]|uniref:hypothetical protein n=1 Tax=Streptomyces lydicus TaxID=47763 RepID=UPI0013E33C5C|nr:hypothetical protein [Streptomyces lydicus]
MAAEVLDDIVPPHRPVRPGKTGDREDGALRQLRVATAREKGQQCLCLLDAALGHRGHDDQTVRHRQGGVGDALRPQMGPAGRAAPRRRPPAAPGHRHGRAHTVRQVGLLGLRRW